MAAAATNDTDLNGTLADAEAEAKPEAPSSTAAEAKAGDNTASAEEAPVETAPDEEVENDASATESGPPAHGGGAEVRKWPGWPGDNVFRLIVPVGKVGSIIGRKGELIKKLCEETRARVRILEGPIGTNDRIVLISGKEELEAEISPAMDAVLRIFKRVNDISDNTADGTSLGSTATAVSSVRLLMASSQAINLIGKKGDVIRSIQESSSANLRVINAGELPCYAAPDERIVEIQGESLKVLKALEAVTGHLRKFLVDHSVLPLFEKTYNTHGTQDQSADALGEKTQYMSHTAQQSTISNDYCLPLKQDSFSFDREYQLDSQIPRSGVALYGLDPSVSGSHSSALWRSGGVLEIVQKMQIPLTYADDIIGRGGGNIAYMRRTSGAVITIQETRGLPDEISVEIKGTSSQVHVARQLIQESMMEHRELARSSYGGPDLGLRLSYSHLDSTAYQSSSMSSLASRSYGGYGSSGAGEYGGYGF